MTMRARCLFLPFYFVSAQGICTESCTYQMNELSQQVSPCPGDYISSFINVSQIHNLCHPHNKSIRIDDLNSTSKVVVIANYEGCEVGMPESSVFVQLARRFHNNFGSRIKFIQLIKGTEQKCGKWAELYNPSLLTNTMKNVTVPWIINDLKDIMPGNIFGYNEFNYPSYLILDKELRVRHTLTGPCCGAQTCNYCTTGAAKDLDGILSNFINVLLVENMDDEMLNNSCAVGNWSEWSPSCCESPAMGMQFRYRSVEGLICPTSIESRKCRLKLDCNGMSPIYRPDINVDSASFYASGIIRIILFLVLVIIIPIIYSVVMKIFHNVNNRNEIEVGEEDTVLSGKDSDDMST